MNSNVIYIDILVAVNIMVNYVILLCVKKINSESVKKIRIMIGAAAGGLFSLIILFDKLGFFLLFFIKIAMSVVIVLITFSVSTKAKLIKNILAFYICNFIFCGLVMILIITFSPVGISMKNGVVYFDVSPLTLIICSVIFYLILSFITYILNRRVSDKKLTDIIISIEGKQIRVKALIDSGHDLRDGITGKTVIICDSKIIEKCLDKNYAEIYNQLKSADKSYKIPNGIKLIPFTALNSAGFILSLLSDYAIVNNKRFDNVYVGISENPLSDGTYNAIIGTDFN